METIDTARLHDAIGGARVPGVWVKGGLIFSGTLLGGGTAGYWYNRWLKRVIPTHGGAP